MTNRIAGIEKPPRPTEQPSRERPDTPRSPDELPPIKEPPISPYIDPNTDSPRRSEDHRGKIFCY
jgi:hypothetical protein